MNPWTPPRDPSELSRENTAQQFPDNVPNRTAKFWIEKLAGDSFLRLQLDEAAAENERPATGGPEIKLGDQGWPVSAAWPGMKTPLTRL